VLQHDVSSRKCQWSEDPDLLRRYLGRAKVYHAYAIVLLLRNTELMYVYIVLLNGLMWQKVKRAPPVAARGFDFFFGVRMKTRQIFYLPVLFCICTSVKLDHNRDASTIEVGIVDLLTPGAIHLFKY
jgi:hypothetical protein